jgi:hypothetical protein
MRRNADAGRRRPVDRRYRFADTTEIPRLVVGVVAADVQQAAAAAGGYGRPR